MTASANGSVRSLYVHVPFCAHKCEYCAFYSEASRGDLVERYVQALIRELHLVAQDLRPRTVFFGGGTPSILSLKQWRDILGTFEKLGLLGADEWTIECNPATVSTDKARLWLDHGVNRISMGVQSLDEALLDRLGRIHSRDMVFRSYDTLRAAGFKSINLDLMFAIPGQTMDIWRATLDETMRLGSEHLSCYEVIYEQDTPLYEQLKAGEFDVDEALACDMYEELIDRSAAAGFQQYEIANFARHNGTNGVTESSSNGASEPHHTANPTLRPSIPSHACQHNINYWRGGDCHAIGPSAAGYVRGVRTKNWSNTPLYCDQLEKGVRAIESREELPALRRAGEIAAFGLRMNTGWPYEQFTDVTRHDLRDQWRTEIDDLVQRGWGESDSAGFRLTRAGLRFADTAAGMFLR
jgi:oxygen-independent coproporphyrinogen III oxidase